MDTRTVWKVHILADGASLVATRDQNDRVIFSWSGSISERCRRKTERAARVMLTKFDLPRPVPKKRKKKKRPQPGQRKLF